jgi:hypothetical protein
MDSVKLYATGREGTVSGHKYKTGQLVDYLGCKRASGVYKITQLLPPGVEAFQYRIKNVKEPHERSQGVRTS